MSMATLTRKEFLQSALGACAGVLGLAVWGCSDQQPPRTDASDGTGGGGGGGGGGNDGSGGGGETLVDAGTGGGGSETVDASTPMSRCIRNGTVATIAANHGHVLVVSKEDVAAGTAKTYNIRGTSSHPHTVVITREHFAQLVAEQAIMTVSSTDSGHSHGIMVACA